MTGRATLALLGAITILAMFAACSSDAKAPATSTRPPADTRVEVTAGAVTVASAGFPVELPAADRDGVLNAMGAYITAATLRPLDGRGTADPIKQLSTASAVTLTEPEQDALVDRDVPRATGPVTVTLTPVNMTGLADRVGTVDLVGAAIDLVVETKSELGPVAIHRTGELMFTREGDAWRILGFRLTVTRDGAGLVSQSSSTTVSAP